MKQIIYETRGRAREFNELAVNLFSGCGHGCIYCYGADVTHQSPEAFILSPRPRVTEAEIIRSAKDWSSRGERRRVLLCFVTDPYQPVEEATQITRKAIKALHANRLNVHILTKGGLRSMRDFDLLTAKDAYATTLTLLTNDDSLHWEPKAALPLARIEALKEAHKRGIETWVSFEPVIKVHDVFKLLELTQDFVGHYKVGTMNYHPHGKNINWRDFGWRIKRLMDQYGARYYFKRELLREMGVNPGDFQQTWRCS